MDNNRAIIRASGSWGHEPRRGGVFRHAMVRWRRQGNHGMPGAAKRLRLTEGGVQIAACGLGVIENIFFIANFNNLIIE